MGKYAGKGDGEDLGEDLDEDLDKDRVCLWYSSRKCGWS